MAIIQRVGRPYLGNIQSCGGDHREVRKDTVPFQIRLVLRMVLDITGPFIDVDPSFDGSALLVPGPSFPLYHGFDHCQITLHIEEIPERSDLQTFCHQSNERGAASIFDPKGKEQDGEVHLLLEKEQ